MIEGEYVCSEGNGKVLGLVHTKDEMFDTHTNYHIVISRLCLGTDTSTSFPTLRRGMKLCT